MISKMDKTYGLRQDEIVEILFINSSYLGQL